jgi:hypothetical protein
MGQDMITSPITTQLKKKRGSAEPTSKQEESYYAPVVEPGICTLSQNYYHVGNKFYDVPTLIAYVDERGYVPFDMPLAGIDLAEMPYSIDDIDELTWHFNRVKHASLEYPIILDNKGSIADGWHRVMKAIIERKSHIKAVRIDVMPDAGHEYKNDKE